MVQVNEFRFNNAVYCKYRHGHYLVKEVAEDSIRIAEPLRGYKFWESYETIIPIELSPDILEACGFVWNDHFGEYKNDLLPTIYLSAANEYQAVWVTSGDSEAHLCGVKYLHQLQNLYFALTGTELSINLEKVKA